MTVYKVTNQQEIEAPTTVTTDHFGVNLLLTQDDELIDPEESMADDLEQLGVSTIRYPGGAVTEDTFDLYHPNLSEAYLEADDPGESIIPLEQFFLEISETDASVSLVIPTRSAFGISAAEAALLAEGTPSSYGNRSLVTEEYIGSPYEGDINVDSSGNPIPDGPELEVDGILGYISYSLKLAEAYDVQISTLEIGNEFWGGGHMTAEEYGTVAGTASQAIAEMLGTPEYGKFNPEIIVQTTTSTSILYSPKDDTVAYVSEENGKLSLISQELLHKPSDRGGYDGQVADDWIEVVIPGQGASKDQGNDIVRSINNIDGAGNAIDGVVIHHYEGSGLDHIDGGGEIKSADNSKGAAFDQLDNFSKNLERDNDEELSYHVTEWNARDSDMYGLKHASMLIEVFFELVANGIDSAQTWPLTFDFQLRSLTDVDDPDGGLSIAGEMFSMMSESLVGLTPVFDYLIHSGEGQDTKFIADTHGFSSDSKLVVFVSERSGDAVNEFSLDLGEFIGDGKYFYTVTELWDGGAGGEDPSAEPILTYSGGIVQKGSEFPLELNNWANARIEITYVGNGDDRVEGRGGDDNIRSYHGDDTLSGGGGRDTFKFKSGDGHDQILDFHQGEDKLVIDSKSITDLYDLPDHLTAISSESGTVIKYGEGDTLLLAGVEIQVAGTVEGYQSIIVGTNFNDKGEVALRGGKGGDYIMGMEGDDQIYGDAGDDRLVDGFGGDNLNGGKGRDVFVFVPGDGRKDKAKDFVRGEDVVDVSLLGVQFFSELTVEFQGDGRFSVTFGSEVFEIYCENSDLLAESDFLFLGDARSSIVVGVVATGDGTDEILEGTIGNDTIVGNSGSDSIISGDGADVISGDHGHDTIGAGNGEDTIEGGKGEDNLRGEGNNDFLSGGDGFDTLHGGGGDDEFDGGKGNDFVQGGNGSDIVRAGSGDDTIKGGNGDDTIKGGTGSDTLKGGEKADRVLGGEGDDRMEGGDGQDTLIGGLGKDTLSGGIGADKFVFDTNMGSENVDKILDFETSLDVIRLDRTEFVNIETGSLSDSSFVSNDSGKSENPLDRIIYNWDTGNVFYDPDGSGSASRVKIFALDPALEISADDFFVFG